MLRQRSISAIGIVLFAAIPAFIGGYVFAAAMLTITVVGINEMCRVYERVGHQPFRWLALTVGSAFIIISAFERPEASLYWLVLLLLLSSLSALLVRDRPNDAVVDWALTFATVAYVALPLYLAVALRATSGDATQHWTNVVAGWFRTPAQGLAWIGIVFSVTWLNDTAAYLLGRQFGKTKLAPRLSPGKTRVGAVAGVVAGTLTGGLAAWLFGASVNLAVAFGIGFVLAVTGQIGDLAESAIKRSLGVKDMGELIPGHGGMLDRIDALLFTFPVTYVLVQVFLRIGWM